MLLRWLCAIIAVLLPTSLFGDGLIIVPHPPHPVPGHFPFAPLEVGYHHVNVKIDSQVAVTTIEQEFINPGPAQLEGTYLFPLPAGAHIDRFAMDIDGKMADAELLSADKARSIYEDIVRRHRDPALLEYVGRDAFKVRVFPIEPHGKKHIRIQYTQILKADAGLVEYTYPLNTEKFSSRPIRDVSVKVELETKRPLKSVYCPSHTAEIKRDGEKRAVIGWEERNVRPDTDFKVVFSTGEEGMGIDVLSYRDDTEGDGFFMFLASPGVQKSTTPAPAKDICFVLDTSGSMAQAGKLDQAKKAMAFCLANLNEQDRFEVIRFSTESESLFDTLQPADSTHITKAREFVRELKPIGGTAIGDALSKAIKARPSADPSRPYVVVFLTDGLPTVGETDEDRLVAKATHDSAPRIFTFGVGTDVNTHLLDRIAQETRGTSQYVLPNEDLEVKLSNFYTKIKEPALTNLKLEMAGVTLQQVYPNELPDLFYGEQLVVLGKYKAGGLRGSVKTAVKLSGTIAGREIAIAEDVEFPDRDTKHEFVPRLWATRRVGWLLDEIRLHGESSELKDEVTQLARRYGIVTPYTAYLILEDEARRNVPVSLRSMRQIELNSAVREDAGGFYGSAKAEGPDPARRSGARAVDNAMRLGQMKGSWNVSQSTQSTPAAVAAPAPADVGYRMQQSAAGQNVQVVNGRAFYQNGTVWVDGTAQTRKDLKQQQIKLGSDEYFALVRANREAAPWLSLGTEVDVVIGDTLYQIR